MKMINKTRQETRTEFGFGKTILRNLAVMALIMSSFLFLTSCAESSSDIAEKTGGVTAGQIVENPAAYNGKTVTVSGDVEEIHGPKAFNMDSGASLGELLVVGREPFPQLPDAENRAYIINDVATITGVIRMLDDKGLKDEIGWDLDPNLLSQFKGKPVLVAQKTSFKAGKASAGTTTDQTKMNADNTKTDGTKTDGTAGAKITDVNVYTSAADKMTLVGKEVDFNKLRVVRVVGPHTFTVASDATGKDEVYVMLDDDASRAVGTQGKIDVGDTVTLSGHFERLDMEQIKDTANDRFRPLTDAEREFLKKTKVYLEVDKFTKVS